MPLLRRITLCSPTAQASSGLLRVAHLRLRLWQRLLTKAKCLSYLNSQEFNFNIPIGFTSFQTCYVFRTQPLLVCTPLCMRALPLCSTSPQPPYPSPPKPSISDHASASIPCLHSRYPGCAIESANFGNKLSLQKSICTKTVKNLRG